MKPYQSWAVWAVVPTLLLLTGGCERERPAAETPVAHEEVPTEPLFTTPAPVIVSGCLRAGEAPETYVLTTSEEQVGEAATYELVLTEDVDLDLQAHVGHTVEISGVFQTPEEGMAGARTRFRPDPAEEARDQPIVETETEVEIRHLLVESVRHVSDRCP